MLLPHRTSESSRHRATQDIKRRWVQLIGFGSFSVGARAARTGRNPATGEAMHIAAAKTVKFTAGKAFKERVNA